MERKYIIQLGIGQVGTELIRILSKAPCSDRWHYVLIANSKGLTIEADGFNPGFLLREAERNTLRLLMNRTFTSPGGLTPQKLFELLPSINPGQTMVIDVTASDETGPLLAHLAELGFGVVLANKKPLTHSWEQFNTLQGTSLGYRATVGTGLPVLQLIAELQAAGRNIGKIEACLSGSLGILCSEIESGRRFSDIVSESVHKGYTEPDPREDLSGMDAARKILILARSCGIRCEMHQINRDILFRTEMQHLSSEQFMQALPSLDEAYFERNLKATSEGKTLRYVATLEGKQLSARLQAVPLDSPLGQLKGAGKAALVYPADDPEHPILVSGSGAGAVATAEDLLKDLELND